MTFLPTSRKPSIGNHLGETVSSHQEPGSYDPKGKQMTRWRLYGVRLVLGAALLSACLLFSRATRAASVEPPEELYQ